MKVFAQQDIDIINDKCRQIKTLVEDKSHYCNDITKMIRDENHAKIVCLAKEIEYVIQVTDKL